MYVKEEKIYPTYLSKHNSNHVKEVILLMIPNLEGCKDRKPTPVDVDGIILH